VTRQINIKRLISLLVNWTQEKKRGRRRKW